MTTRATPRSSLEERALGGDHRAFGELIRTWDDSLRAVVWSVVRSAVDTDDVMQASYEKAFRSILDFRGESSMKTWMHSICLRTAIDHVRYESRRRHDSDDVLARRAASSSTSDTALGRAELADALDMLDPQTRALIMLTVGLGYSFDEVASMADMPRGTVASKVARGKQQLRRRNASPDHERNAR